MTHRPEFDPAANLPSPYAVATLEVETAGEFLPLAVRRVLYVIALTAAAVAPVLAVTHPEYAVAIVTGAGVLNAAALGTALANPSR